MKNSEVIDKYNSEGSAACIAFLVNQHQEILSLDAQNTPSRRAYSKKVDQLLSTYRTLKKNKSRPSVAEKLQHLLEGDFQFPSKVTQSGSSEPVPGPSGLSLQSQLDSQKQVSIDLAKELHESKEECKLLSAKRSRLLGRKDELKICQAKLRAKTTECKALATNNDVLQERVKTKTAELKRKRAQVRYLQDRYEQHVKT